MDGRSEVVLLSDRRIGAIGVAVSAEPLVLLRPTDRISVASSTPLPPIGLASWEVGNAYAHVREGLAARLADAGRRLPADLRLHVVEGYRPLAVQRRYFEAYRRKLQREIPALTAEESHALASRFVAPLEVAAHTSGAAVDVTLIDADGRELEMGTPIDATPEESGGDCYFESPRLSPRVRANRALLARCLTGAGLVNYPTEWWHWSYGDRYWAFTLGRPEAIYGPLAEPAD